MKESWLLPLITYTISFMLHCIGLCLLCFRGTRTGKNQKIFLMNLSASEICICLTGALQCLFSKQYGEDHLAYKLSTVSCLTFALPYYMIMISLTVDRFGEVYMNIRYHLYWSTRLTRYLMATIWLINTTLLVVSLIKLLKNANATSQYLKRLYYIYIYQTADIIFLIIAVVTYVYITKKLVKNRKLSSTSVSISLSTEQSILFNENNEIILPLHSNHATHSIQRKSNVMRRRRFLLPTLLVVTFIMFVVVPDMVNFFVHNYSPEQEPLFRTICEVAYGLGYLSDATIYVLLSIPFRNKNNFQITQRRRK